MHAAINIGINAIRNAGKIIMRSLDRLEREHISNQGRIEAALEARAIANKSMATIILDLYPHHKVVGDHIEADEYTETDFVWIIDAIDGIINYAHGLPHFAATIAVKHKHKILHSLIYDPIHQELFTASHGEGATLNDHRIRVSPHKELTKALLATTAPAQQGNLQSHNQIICELLPQIAGMRNYGCPVLDLAYVAAGKLEGFWGFGMSESSIAAGALLVVEAGGIVSDFAASENYAESGNIIAVNPKNFKALLKIIQANI